MTRSVTLLAILLLASATLAEDYDPRALTRANAVMFRTVSNACGGCVVGISIGDPANNRTWRIDFAPTATGAQRDKAIAALASFDYVRAMDGNGSGP